jgi:hypothetical protein
MRAAALTSPRCPGRMFARAGQVRATPGAPTIWKGTD